MDRDAAVGLDHDESIRLGKMSGEAACVVDRAASNDEAHVDGP